jgi:hypothetical protein
LHREAVHVGAIEVWHVQRRDDIRGQHPVQRVRQRHRLRLQRPQVEHGAEAALGLIAVDHVEELLLPQRVIHVGLS